MNKGRSQPRRLFRAAKISDYRLKRVVQQFARDASATDAARATGISINAAHELYRKLRVFFFDVGLFVDYYGGLDALAFQGDDLRFEHALLSYHLKRYGEKRGFKSPSDQPHYHFAESHWRFHFTVLMGERPSEAVYFMMQRHLMELIRACGPIGTTPRNRAIGLRIVLRQADERIEWLRLNGPRFRSYRQELAEVLAIPAEV
jgi:hypothetical protein